MARPPLAWLIWLLAGLLCPSPILLPAQEAAPDATAAAEPEASAEEEKKSEGALPESWAKEVRWRSIGPANMGGRITALAMSQQDPCVWWAATASGGLLKTTNNGITFEHQFDHEATVSIGDVAVAPSNHDIIWVGTGESNPRNSVSWGDGVYRSTDGGKTWKNMGLGRTFQIGRIAIHPENPDVVYIGALGRLWGPNEERGLFKTADGGETWEKVLYVNERTGVIDVQMHPTNPDTLLVATYERKRDGFDSNDPEVKFGEGTGLHKTTDGGATWREITEGLPSVKLGRIGIDYYRKNPDVVFLVLESEKIGKQPPDMAYMGVTGENADVGARLTSVVEKGPAASAGLKKDDIVIAVGDTTVHSYNELLATVRKHTAGETVSVEVSRNRQGVMLDLTFAKVPENNEQNGNQRGRRGGRRNPFSGFLGGQAPNLQDQQGKEGHEYGGIYRSADGGESWTRINSVNPRPMYFSQVRVDPSDENHIFVLGVSLYRSKDGGKTFTSDGGRGVHVDHHALWIDPKDGRHMILGNDGGIYVTYSRMDHWDHFNHVAIGQFYDVTVGPRRNYRVYGGLQDNGSWGGPSRVANGSGAVNEDWISIGGGDGFVCRVDAHDPDLIYYESQNGGMGRRHLVTGERARIRPRAPRGTRYRFNWKSPFHLSHHNSKMYYVAGNHVFRSYDRGNGLKRISPEITGTDRGSATALAESPRNPDVLYVGTDDGALWATTNGGQSWTSIYDVPKPVDPKEVTKSTILVSVEQDPQEGQDPPQRGQRGRRGRGQLAERLKEMDENGDGKIQKSEVPERMERMFDRIDANDDGVIDTKEIEAFSAQRGAGGGGEGRRGRRGGRRGEGDDSGNEAPETRQEESSGPPALNALLPGPRWVSSLEASRFETARAYVTFDGHRSDDDEPYVFVTEDHGKTWTSIRNNLPTSAGSTKVVQEDLKNENILYLGCEFSTWVSIDRGKSWTRLSGGDLPTVAVHAFAQHPTAGEIVAGTHGRSLWIADITALRQMKPELVKANAHLYRPNTAVLWRSEPRRGGTNRRFVGQNPGSGAAIYYSIGEETSNVSLKVTSESGETLAELEAKGEPGLHRVTWDLRRARTGARAQGNQRFGFRRGPRVRPGTYHVVLTAGGKELEQELRVEIDPDHPDPAWITFEELAEELEEDGEEEEGEDTGPYRGDF